MILGSWLQSVSRASVAVLGAAALSAVTFPAAAAAQTDFYNTDRGRPLQIEDAYSTERYAFELQLAPLRLERAQGGAYNWGVEPEIAYGILPRTQIEVGLPLAYLDRGASRRASGVAGVEVALLHNLNAETETLPALAIAGDVILPLGSLGPNRAYPSVKGVVTRTYSWLRFHLNGQYTVTGDVDASDAASGAGAGEVSRWLAGVAIDRTFPLRSLLIGAETFARQPLTADEPVEWDGAAGIRYQLAPQFAIDGGLGARLSGEDRGWYFTFGMAYAFGVRSLIPRGGN